MGRRRVSAYLFVIILAGGGQAWASGSGMSGGGGMPSMTAPSYDPAEEYRAGIEALKAAKYDEAIRAFDHVLEAAPRNADVLLLSGMAKSGKGDLKGAERAYEKAIKVEPGKIAAHQQLGVTLVQLKQTDKAKAELDLLKKKAAECGDSCKDAADLKAAVAAVDASLAPTTPAAGQQSAPSAAPAGTQPAAPASIGSLLFTDPGHGDRAYVQAVGLINERRYLEALDSLHAAERAFGPHPDVLTYLGYTSRKLGRYADAERYYRAVLAIAPGHRGATEYYGELKVVRGDLTGARRLLARLDSSCSFGCAEAEELRRWVEHGPPSP